MIKFYLGTYSTKLDHVNGQAIGISYWTIDTDNGTLKQHGEEIPIENSSYLCLDKDHQFLYAISEIVEYEGRANGCLTVFKIRPDGSLHKVQQTSAHGIGPAHLSFDQTGRFLLLANYLAGNITVFPVLSDGSLGEPTSKVQHYGHSVNPARQEGPHPHNIIANPGNTLVHVTDLGLDRIVTYAFDEQTGVLKAHPEHDIHLPPGSGPRHLVFSPDGQFAFLCLELSNQVCLLQNHDGQLKKLASYALLPEDFQGLSHAAEIRCSPNGQFVYVSNRGHDSLSVFEFNPTTLQLKRVQVIKTGGETPRGFTLTPQGDWLVVAHQDSHTLISFKVNTSSGLLESSHQHASTKSPVVVCFVAGGH
jgi:6-phosphogluconolactonase